MKSIKASERLSLSGWHIHGGCCTSHSFFVTSRLICIDGINSNLYEGHEGRIFFYIWTQNFWFNLNRDTKLTCRPVDGEPVFLNSRIKEGLTNLFVSENKGTFFSCQFIINSSTGTGFHNEPMEGSGCRGTPPRMGSLCPVKAARAEIPSHSHFFVFLIHIKWQEFRTGHALTWADLAGFCM